MLQARCLRALLWLCGAGSKPSCLTTGSWVQAVQHLVAGFSYGWLAQGHSALTAQEVPTSTTLQASDNARFLAG